MSEFIFKPFQELKKTSNKVSSGPVPSQKTFVPEKNKLQMPIDEPDKTDKTTLTPSIGGFVSFVSAKVEHLALQNLSNAARVRLSDYRRKHGKQEANAWLEHFNKAHAACMETFSEDRRDNLTDYGRRYCHGQAAQVIAAHTIALELWTIHRQAQTGKFYGFCLEAACKACGLDADRLPESREENADGMTEPNSRAVSSETPIWEVVP